MPRAKKAVSKWSDLANVAVTKILCEGYSPQHTVLLGCHTSLPATPDMLSRHTLEQGHGGGFHLNLKPDEEDGGFWERLGELGLEAVDFRCGVCGKRLPLMGAAVREHIKPHLDLNRQMTVGGLFYLTVGRAASVEYMAQTDEAVEE